MKRLLGAILLVTFLNGCAGLPLISTLEGSLSINGAVGLATGKYETQAANALINLASHQSTGKTVSQHLYAMAETKYTKKRLEKHFKNKELSVTTFEIANKSLSDFGGFLPKDFGGWNFGKKKVKTIKTKTKVTDPSINSIPDIFYTQPRKVASYNNNNNNAQIHAVSPTHVLSINNSAVEYVKLTKFTVLDKYAPNFKHKIKQKAYKHCFRSSGLNVILNIQYCNNTPEVTDIVF